MNYIKEINAFYDWLETNSLSTSGIVLWHALMHINNKAGWAEEFAVATSVLSVKTGLAVRTISKARNELKQKGRINWRSRNGSRSALYKLISLSASSACNHANKSNDNNLPAPHADNHADKCADNHASNHADNRATLYKLNETKLNSINNNHIDLKSDVFTRIEQEFGRPLRPAEYQEIAQAQREHAPELIDEALKRTVLNQAFNVRYLTAILHNWQIKGIKTLADVERADNLHQKTKDKPKKPSGSHRTVKQTDTGPPEYYKNYKQLF